MKANEQKSNAGPRAHIGTGYRVGHLTVTRATEARKNGYTVWSCRCDCGGTIFLDTRCLQRETVTDCGCISKTKPGQKDLTGMRFGKLIAIAPTERRSNGSVVWRCRCDCGGEVDVPLHQLTGGYRKSCGCLGHPPLKDYIGKRFGYLTVTGYAGKKNGMHRWKCRCDCGNSTIVGQTLLQTGKTKSCGCLQAETYRENLKLVEGTSITVLESNRKRLRSNNTSGYTGVYMDKRSGHWVAQMGFQGKRYSLGTYQKKNAAIKARKQAEQIYDDFLAWYYAAVKEQETEVSSE